MLQHELRHHRHYLLEYLAALLRDELVGIVFRFRREAVHRAEIVANIVGIDGLQPRADDFPRVFPVRRLRALDNAGGCRIAKNEMRFAVAQV